MLPPDTLIIGGTGLLGRALVGIGDPSTTATWHRAPPAGHDAVRWMALDLARDHLDPLIDRVGPSVIVNAAYSRGGPDLTEVTERAPVRLAEAARSVGARLVHLSTDVVFAGDRPSPYVESDRPAPVHDYGRAKAAAERGVQVADAHSLVVRTSLLYGSPEGEQERLVRDAAAGAVTFYTDEVRAPVHVDDLAHAIAALVTAGIEGIVHLAGADAVDRLTFARLLAPSVGVDPATLQGGATDPHQVRPRHVVLETERADLAGLAPLPGCRSRLG